LPDILGLTAALTGGTLALLVLAEIGLRVALARPLPRDFYGSIPRERVRERQLAVGVRVATGPGWLHLAWIADPERERYHVERLEAGSWRRVARPRLGSWLGREGGRYRVWALRRREGAERLLGEVAAWPDPGRAPLLVPRVAGPWRPLFRPARHGRYVNDHTVYRDAAGRWRLLGITSHSEGDWDAERWFASAWSESFPPPGGMTEGERVADLGELAWAPAVIRHGSTWHLYWSPHRLHHMVSDDGVRFREHRIAMAAPRHAFFRDASLMQVADGQWLLHCTARGRFFSRVDVYQSFDLREWQYAGVALRCGLGSERNAAFASTESPLVTRHEGRFYLTLTYDNGTFFWSALALRRRRPHPARYNDTRVFHADQPWDFGVYRGRRCTRSLLARIEAHAPRLIRHPESGAWWITTAGWPWAASLTRGEVAVAPLRWDPASPRAERSRPEPVEVARTRASGTG
jgi:beta-fructofuranosidase